MKPIITLILIAISVHSIAQNDKEDTPTTVTKDTTKAHNSFLFKVASGMIIPTDNGTSKTGSKTKVDLFHSFQFDYNIKKHPNQIYFSVGALANTGKARLSLLDSTFNRYSRSFPVWFIGIPLSLNIPIKFLKSIKLVNRFSAIPSIRSNTNPLRPQKTHPELCFQYAAHFYYKNAFAGIQIFRPLGVYGFDAKNSSLYNLTGFMLTVGIELSK